MAARSHDKLEALAAECKQLGSLDAYAVPYDASDSAQSAVLVAKAADSLGGLDVLVLDHVAPPHSGDYRVAEAAVKKLKAVAEVDFYSYVSLAQHALNVFQRQYEVLGPLCTVTS